MKESALGDRGGGHAHGHGGGHAAVHVARAGHGRGERADGRADLYSLGVVLYEMVTGRLPFESDTAMGIILHHLQTPPPEPREVRADLGIPDSLSAVLMQALQKEPGRRFSSATAMATALQGGLALPLPGRPGSASAATAGSSRPPTPPPVPFDIDATRRASGRRLARLGLRCTRRAHGGPHAPPIPQTPALSHDEGPVAELTSPGSGGYQVPLRPPRRPDRLQPLRRAPRPWDSATRWGVLSFFNRDSSKSKRRDAQPSPSPSAGESVDRDLQDVQDGVIAVALQRALRSNPRTRRADIEVEVDEGVVSLSGKASSAAAHDAEMMARRVEGVKDVVSTIDIESREAGNVRKN